MCAVGNRYVQHAEGVLDRDFIGTKCSNIASWFNAYE